MEIKVYGTGCCSNCGDLFDMMQAKVKDLGIDANVEKITDMAEIISAGIMSAPAVAIDGEIVHAGGMPSAEAVSEWFK